jgi:hypothetical protein
MSKKKNSYAKKAKKKSFMQGMNSGLPTKGNVKNTLLETGKDLLVGVIGGGLVGAAIGKPSLAIGTLVTGVGHYADNRLATLFGIGIMASNGFQRGKSVSGLEGMDGIKDRLMAYKESFGEKLYLDKIIKSKSEAANGIGSVQYFNYPEEAYTINGPSLDEIEDQIAESGRRHYELSGSNFDMSNADIEMDERLL